MIANEAVVLPAATVTLLVRGGGSANDKREIRFRTALADLLIGGSGISAGLGTAFPANTTFIIHLPVNEDLYGFSTTGGTVNVMATRSGSPTEVNN